MNEDFVTEAIRDDRCLKAHRLLSRFEDELEAEVTRMGKAMIADHPDLFPDDAEPGSGFSIGWNNNTIIANARDNIDLSRVSKEDPSSNLRLNVSVRWVDPIDWDEDDVEGALCAACYKLNSGDRADFEAVKQDTADSEWTLNFGADQFNNAPGILYIPVESGAELRAATDELIEHFRTFGGYWGIDPAEVETDE